MPAEQKFELLGLNLEELTAVAVEKGQPQYRGEQLAEAIYRQRVTSVDAISTLPFAFRTVLADAGFRIGRPVIHRSFASVDGTVRYLIRLSDSESVETVWMPEGDGGEAGDGTEAGDAESATRAPSWNRATICVSSQVGCAVNCQFCLTAKLGIRRNLSAGEIVGQVLDVLSDQKVAMEQQRINLVFMGMGEPFLNYENFMKAVRLLVQEVGFPESRMTVSTAGIVSRIIDFGKESIRPKLAISLNGSNDAGREDVMPINRKWSLDALLEAARTFPLRSREKLTFEYVLLRGVNDSINNAREVVHLLRGIRAKVNLIALNPGPDLPFGTPSEEIVAAFQQVLIRGGIPAFVRRPRGRDIYAACGQLKRTEELVAIGS
ncbi:MAG TPA: 23S rRNA (adenine(2503)-C(2))-methyltransferase RlmN [Terriglobales bacterium]|nr:23S rRNA (adenine(2503)-C(2))-methyltransferase RlmN [Terriglobales bacterium]